jgi:hypothetical protein|tara:strand:+ start:439 stop:816 length:378 start_codon:yes stop_codon:yes gene_type:complete
MANPDYASLLAQIAAETDPVIKAQLEAQCYVFADSLTDAERELFEFAAFDYIEDNPGYVDGAFTPGLYVLADYVADGYINTVEADVGLYMAAGYTLDGYVETTGGVNSGFISYAGVYYNDNGERT